FSWLNPLLDLGQKRMLEEDDMFAVLPEDQAEVVGEELQRFWDHETKEAFRELRRPSLCRALIRCYGKAYATTGLFVFSLEAIKVLQPLLLWKIVHFFENYEPGDQRGLILAYAHAAALSLSALGLAVLQHLYYYTVLRLGMKMRVALCHMIYRKALVLSSEATVLTTTGQIVNLLANDVNHFDEITLELHYLWVGPVQALVIVVLLWYEVGPSCLAGLGAVILMLPLQTWFGKLFGIFRSKSAALADQRIRVMNEVSVRHQNHQDVRLGETLRRSGGRGQEEGNRSGHEELLPAGAQHGLLLRQQQDDCLRHLRRLRADGERHRRQHGVRHRVPVRDHQTDRHPLLPSGCGALVGDGGQRAQDPGGPAGSSRVRCSGAGGLLTASPLAELSAAGGSAERSGTAASGGEEESGGAPHDREDDLLLGQGEGGTEGRRDGGRCVSVCVYSLFCPASVRGCSLSEEHLRLCEAAAAPGCDWPSWGWKGEWTQVCGCVCVCVCPSVSTMSLSPQSSLLSAILGELPHDSGRLRVQGQVTYAAQQPWVFPGTIQSNILFGREMIPGRYETVLEACALKRDLDLLPSGDLTLIGDRGATLSGGQRARVNLARAVYQDADIYLLDDPLSAVDAEVGKHLFEQCVCGLLKDKCRVLVTHQLQHLRAADHILLLQEGQITAQGTYRELLRSGLDVVSLMRSEEEQEERAQTAELDQQSLHSQSSSRSHSSQCSFSSLLPPDRGKPPVREHDGVSRSPSTAEPVPSLSEEARAEGDVSRRVYLKYFTAGCNAAFLMLILLLSITAEVAYILQDWWLVYWAREEFSNSTANLTGADVNVTPSHQFNLTFYLSIYSGLTAAAVGFGYARCFVIFHKLVRSAQRLHDSMFNAVIRTSAGFFDLNPIGRPGLTMLLPTSSAQTLSSFSPLCRTDSEQVFQRHRSDRLQVTHHLRRLLSGEKRLKCTFLESCDAVSFSHTCFFFLDVFAERRRGGRGGFGHPPPARPHPSAAAVFLVLEAFLPPHLPRRKTPRGYHSESHLLSSVVISSGLVDHPSLQSPGQTAASLRRPSGPALRFGVRTHWESEAWFLFLMTSRWFAFRLDSICSVFITLATFGCIFFRNGLEAGEVGLVLTYAVTLVGNFQWTMRQSAEVENMVRSEGHCCL
ncbi:unnamed protein product, partial [Tetraodon nigroviridis]